MRLHAHRGGSFFFITAYARTTEKRAPDWEGRAVRNVDMLLQGGTVVTPFGAYEADIWIENGVIRRVAKDTMRKKRENGRESVTEEIIDASDYYIVPGFLTLANMQTNRLRKVANYLDQVRSLMKKGITYLVHTVQVESWMKEEQLLYQLTTHYNNPIDYSIQLGLQSSQFQVDTLRKLCSLGFRLFQLTVRDLREIQQINWEALSALLDREKPCIQLRIAEDAQLSVEQKKEIIRCWLNDCRYRKVRTAMKELDLFDISERDPYYHLSIASGEMSTKLFEYLAKNWYHYLPAIAPLDQLSLQQSRRRWNPEVLLSLLVRVASANMAKAIGCYPRKGSLLPGADADLCLLQKDAWLTNIALSTILNFSEICLPARVMSKGRWLYQEGTYAPVLGIGSFLTDIKPYNYVI